MESIWKTGTAANYHASTKNNEAADAGDYIDVDDGGDNHNIDDEDDGNDDDNDGWRDSDDKGGGNEDGDDDDHDDFFPLVFDTPGQRQFPQKDVAVGDADNGKESDDDPRRQEH